jgi:hypothetical protein
MAVTQKLMLWMEKKIKKLSCFPSFDIQDPDYPKGDRVHWKPFRMNDDSRFCGTLAQAMVTQPETMGMLDIIYFAAKDAFSNFRKFDVFLIVGGNEGRPSPSSGIKNYIQQFAYWTSIQTAEVQKLITDKDLLKIYAKALKAKAK